MRSLLSLSLAAALLVPVASAWAQQAAPRTPQGAGQSMLVLDASGSMWGQIGGKAKIEIAREAVGSMLATWPANQQLGLMAYGHRSKGNCADIEMLKAPGPVDKAGMQQAVNALQPKGMTPISASVRMAAEQLKFGERKATVILVSDGEETCHADPCALGKELEKLGVDFTAHVVGFDIDKNPKAKAQLQCLASSTGGRYLDAKDAGELNKALREVAQAPAPTPAPAAPPPACGNFVEGPEFAMNLSTWPTGEHASLSAEPKPFEPLEMGKDANARACQKLCTDDKTCTAWFFEAIGSNFRTLPVCHRWDGVAALSAPHEGHPGNAMGIKKGVRQIVREAGAACK
ncbi:vWA domain-containing protein [Acidovorax sp.]|uniref:vWA domain-containing protein n=1 Tax=Acidovorax sp. TaxID=1872122 RepID=UPI00391A72C2